MRFRERHSLLAALLFILLLNSFSGEPNLSKPPIHSSPSEQKILFQPVTSSTAGAAISDSGNQTTYNIQVGAWGDNTSIGNMGVAAEIRTAIYSIPSQDLNAAFWVGDNLQNGAFIQFGYQLAAAGNYCLYGEETSNTDNCLGSSTYIGFDDARWFWEYWPDPTITDFYYGIGALGSSGAEGSWHLYQIIPNPSNGWNFVLDGQLAQSLNNFQASESKDQAYIVAEEVTSSPSASGILGPVEFRDLAYMTPYGWHDVTSLTEILGCGVLNSKCGSIPYGVSLVGPNDILAGAGQKSRTDGASLWKGLVGGATLSLDLPTQITARVDGQLMLSGPSKLPLLLGPHTVEVPTIIPINANNRLRFDHWSDGSLSANRTLILDADTTLTAIYQLQYTLSIDSVVPLNRSGWFDEGSAISLSKPSSILLNPNQGIMGGQWAFDGWYEDGRYLANSNNLSIVMDRPHTLELHWHRDYTTPIEILTGLTLAIAAITAIAAAALVRRRRRKRTDTQVQLS